MFDGDLLAERARLTPAKTALVFVETGERLTYADLDRRVDDAARLVSAQGIGSGDRYGLLAFNSIEFVELFLAAGRIGAIVVPLSTRATAHELRGIIADSGMKALFFGAEFAAIVDECREALSAPAKLIPVDAERPRDVEAPRVEASQEDVWCLLYTSGTTGKPKGVMIPRRQLWWNGYNTAICWALRDDDVTPVFTPLYHAGGLAAFMIPVFAAGGTVVLHKTFDPAVVWRTIADEKCTVVLGVPTIWKLLMDAPAFSSTDLSHVRWFISGGAPLPHYIIDAYQKRGVVMKQGYGMTEVGVNCFSMTVEESFLKPGSIGKPMMFTAIRIVDGEGADVAPGEVGEMLIRGPHVSRGYFNNEAATREAYLEGGWFRTGDLARRDEDGFFYIAGRRKEMFISGGVNVYPAEIEAELVSHSAVSDAAVVPVADATWGEVAVAFVVGNDVTADDLAEYLTLRIAKYKVPKRFIFVDSLPRTPYGKVVKDELRKALG
jgi:fatty-acyl-CoA synthase